MGRHDFDRTQVHLRPVVGRHHSRWRHLYRFAWLQPPRRRPARLARPPSEAAQLSKLVEIENLRVAFRTDDGGWKDAVRGVSFSLGREKLGIVGESGSGKSLTGRALLG